MVHKSLVDFLRELQVATLMEALDDLELDF